MVLEFLNFLLLQRHWYWRFVSNFNNSTRTSIEKILVLGKHFYRSSVIQPPSKAERKFYFQTLTNVSKVLLQNSARLVFKPYYGHPKPILNNYKLRRLFYSNRSIIPSRVLLTCNKFYVVKLLRGTTLVWGIYAFWAFVIIEIVKNDVAKTFSLTLKVADGKEFEGKCS